MKKLLLIATAAFMLANAYGQDTARNFLSVNAELQWKKTYAVETDFKTALLKVKEAGIFNSVDTIGNKIMMHINDFSMDAREAGYRIMKTPTYISVPNHTAYAVLTVSDSSITVNLKKFKTVSVDNIGFFGFRGEKQDMNFWVIDKSGMLDAYFKKAGAPVYNFFLEKMFSALIKDF